MFLNFDNFMFQVSTNILDSKVECWRVALKRVCILSPMLNETKDFVNFKPVLHFLSIVLERLLVFLDNGLLDIGQVVKLLENISQLSPI